jgi:hypothetical protein
MASYGQGEEVLASEQAGSHQVCVCVCVCGGATQLNRASIILRWVSQCFSNTETTGSASGFEWVHCDQLYE